MRKRVLLPMSVLLCCAYVFAQRTTPETKIITQPTAPLKITSLSAEYYSESSRYVERGIHYELKYENVSARNVVAVEFGLVAFDIWNEFLDRTGGITMTPLSAGSSDKGEWVASRYADFSFHTGVAYISKVRFDNGEIWSADTSSVLLELRKIQKDFDASKLKKKQDDRP